MNLSNGRNLEGGVSLKERAIALKKSSKEMAQDVVEEAIKIGVIECSKNFSISKEAVSKYLSRALKKRDDISISNFLEGSRVSEIEEYLINSNTTSIKRLVLGSNNIDEWELRLVLAALKQKGADSWDY